MKLHIINIKGTFDISGLVTNIRWSGDKRQAARTLEISVVSSAVDKNIPVVDWALGAVVEMFEGKEKLFYGKIVNRSKNTESSNMSITCHDNGRLMKRNKVIKKYEEKTPEFIAEQLANEFKFSIGSIVKTGIPITRLFLSGSDNIYDVVMTAYTLAGKKNNKKYHIGFRGEKLYITEIGIDENTLVIQGKSNLIATNTTESIENMVSEVQIYDESDKLVKTLKEKDREKVYDLIREIVKQSKGDDKAEEAQRILDDNGIKQTISIDAIGNLANVSGGSVVLQEPYTELYGLFFIESDVHEWKNGQYYSKLTLNIENIMDEKEVGTLPNATGNKTKSSGFSEVKEKKIGGGGGGSPVYYSY